MSQGSWIAESVLQTKGIWVGKKPGRGGVIERVEFEA